MDVTTKLTEIIQAIKDATYEKENAWETYSYRKMAAAFKVPYNDVKLVTTQLRAHPNIDYRYVPMEARYRPIKYRYVDFQDNSIILDKFQQLTSKEFNYVSSCIDKNLPNGTEEERFTYKVILLVIIEEMKKENYLTNWTPAKIGNIVRYTGWNYRQVEDALDLLCEDRILKQLGASASYRMALCEEDYEKLTDESYTEQFQTVLENSKSVTENGTGDTFQVLTELNNFEENLRETIAFNSEIGSRLLKQQKILRALQEKENVYAGTLVRMDAVTRNYADTMQENQKLKEENKDLKQRMKLTDKFYAQQRENISAQLDEMSSRLISSLEEYFSRPVREKNQVSVSNRTKTELIRIIFETIDNVKKGKSE